MPEQKNTNRCSITMNVDHQHSVTVVFHNMRLLMMAGKIPTYATQHCRSVSNCHKI